MILLFGRNIGHSGVVPNSESVPLAKSHLGNTPNRRRWTGKLPETPFFENDVPAVQAQSDLLQPSIRSLRYLSTSARDDSMPEAMSPIKITPTARFGYQEGGPKATRRAFAQKRVVTKCVRNEAGAPVRLMPRSRHRSPESRLRQLSSRNPKRQAISAAEIPTRVNACHQLGVANPISSIPPRP